ncbi:hypothetical protein [Microcoleus sp. FACHB-672]|uniref:hypothetical protein n=1 Tax=Microcoleus sp. FACHB-672 TaxID=2692825 RepID=UPI00168A3702|nr:hypothetical protein [Microcoleus sp. FACHB-672]MBD2041577.1 hypothetical protein [Microcoleus sp. FACHB-672]
MSFLESPPLSPSQGKGSSELTKNFNLPASNRQTISTPAEIIQLDFESLTALEGLSNQYSCLGVRFSGAIALQPSNPALARYSRSQVLMPVANLTGITVQFPCALNTAGASVMGSKPVVVTAFDANNDSIEKISTQVTYSISPSAEQFLPLPHNRLEVKGLNIVKLVFFSAAPFILDDLFFYQ